MEWVDECTAVWFMERPCQWIYGSPEVFVFPEWSVAIIVTHMWTPTTPTHTHTLALLNIDKQSRKCCPPPHNKTTNINRIGYIQAGISHNPLGEKRAAALLQTNKQCLERSLSINVLLTYLRANIYHEIGVAARPTKQTQQQTRSEPAPRSHEELNVTEVVWGRLPPPR